RFVAISRRSRRRHRGGRLHRQNRVRLSSNGVFEKSSAGGTASRSRARDHFNLESFNLHCWPWHWQDTDEISPTLSHRRYIEFKTLYLKPISGRELVPTAVADLVGRVRNRKFSRACPGGARAHAHALAACGDFYAIRQRNAEAPSTTLGFGTGVAAEKAQH